MYLPMDLILYTQIPHVRLVIVKLKNIMIDSIENILLTLGRVVHDVRRHAEELY